MEFIKNLVINVLVILGMGLFIYFLFPGMMGLVYQAMYGLLGPLLIVMIIVAAIPPKSRSYRHRRKYSEAGDSWGNRSSGVFGIAGQSTRRGASEKHKSSRNYLILMVVIFIIGMVLISKSQELGIGLLGALALIVAIRFLLDWADSRGKSKRREERKYVRGAIAEEEIGLNLVGLGEGCFILNDVRSAYGNIDHIVIHKQNGVFLLETKSHRGSVSIENGKIFINHHEPEKDFLAQILRNTYWLRGHIKEKLGLETWIKPILIFTDAFVPYNLPEIKNVTILNPRFLLKALEKPNIKPIHQSIWEKREKIAGILS